MTKKKECQRNDPVDRQIEEFRTAENILAKAVILQVFDEGVPDRPASVIPSPPVVFQELQRRMPCELRRAIGVPIRFASIQPYPVDELLPEVQEFVFNYFYELWGLPSRNGIISSSVNGSVGRRPTPYSYLFLLAQIDSEIVGTDDQKKKNQKIAERMHWIIPASPPEERAKAANRIKQQVAIARARLKYRPLYLLVKNSA